MTKESKGKVVTLGEYISKVGNEVAGIDKVKRAINLIIEERGIKHLFERKGEVFFITER